MVRGLRKSADLAPRAAKVESAVASDEFWTSESLAELGIETTATGKLPTDDDDDDPDKAGNVAGMDASRSRN